MRIISQILLLYFVLSAGISFASAGTTHYICNEIETEYEIEEDSFVDLPILFGFLDLLTKSISCSQEISLLLKSNIEILTFSTPTYFKYHLDLPPPYRA